MVERLDETVLRMQRKLHMFLKNTFKKYSGHIPWSWLCVKLLKLVSSYSSGITEAIIISELHSQYMKTNGLLSTDIFHQNRKNSSVSEVLDLRAVPFETVMEVRISSVHCIPGTTTKIVHLVDVENNSRYVEMYLHRKFYDLVPLLQSHTLRMTVLRLVGTQSTPLRFLPTEHVMVVMDTAKDQELQNKFQPLWSVFKEICSMNQADYIQNIFAKVVSVGAEEVVHAPDGTSYRRLIVKLEVSLEHRTSVHLVLWDLYVKFAKLFDKGDVLYIQQAYAKPCATVASGDIAPFCLEYGPATVLYLAPYTPQLEIVPTQHQKSKSPISVNKTEDGKLDFLCYPERLVIADVVPEMVNGVMVVRCEGWSIGGEEEEEEEEEEGGRTEGDCRGKKRENVILHTSDHTGRMEIVLKGFGMDTYLCIYPSQCLVLTGLSSSQDKEGSLFLTCDSKSGATLINASSLQGWLLSPSLCSHLSLGSLSTDSDHFTTIARLKEWKVLNGCGWKVWSPPHHYQMDTDRDKEDTNNGVIRYTLGAVFMDTTGSLEVEFTSTAAECLLHKAPTEFKKLSEIERQMTLSYFVETEVMLCISKVAAGYFQVNMISVS